MKEDKSRLDRGLVKSPRPAAWVQTERATHEAWAQLALRSPRAAALMHVICAQMQEGREAVVASWGTLADISGMSESTVRRAVRELASLDWIEVVQVGRGGANALVVNSRVAWTKRREDLAFARFGATVLARSVDQDAATLAAASTPLRRLPMMRPGEWQLPAGEGASPPSQPSLDGLDPPDIPALRG